MGNWIMALGLGLWVLAQPWRWRDLNRPAANAPLYPGLGLANALTLGRGLLLPLLAYWALAGLPLDNWLGGGVYLLFILLDFADGLTARLTRRPSLLGAALDMHYDGWGVFLAAALLVRLGKAPGWYLLVGLARPLYLLATGLWQRGGRPLHPLTDKPLRRTLAGLQMAYLALALLPLFAPAATRWFAWLFGLPFLINFADDFLQQADWPRPPWPSGPGMRLLWTLTRLLAAAAALSLARGVDDWAIGGALLLLGLLPRLSAAGLLLRAALSLSAPPTLPLALTTLLLALVLHFGGGRWTLWAPEEALFTRHLGG